MAQDSTVDKAKSWKTIQTQVQSQARKVEQIRKDAERKTR